MTGETVESILDFAIRSEAMAADFYTNLAERAENDAIKKVLRGFAAEERGHKAKLEKIKEGAELVKAEQKIVDLKIAEQVVDVEPQGEIDYKAALIVAMKAEQAAHRLYSDLATATDDPGLRLVLQALADEEAKHKLRFESEYDDYISREN